MTSRGSAMPRVAIAYEHLSPAQVEALKVAGARLAAAGYALRPVEFFGVSPAYGWRLDDARRPAGWTCLYPDGPPRLRLQVFVRLARWLARERVHLAILNGWWDPVSWWLWACAPFLDARLAFVGDSTHVDRTRRRAVEAAKRLFLRRMRAVFTAGRRQRAYLESLGVPTARIALGCDVVDNGRFSHVERAPCEGRLVIGTAARLVEEKNLVPALEAFARVAQRNSADTVWRIAGRGPLDGILRKRIAELGVDAELVGFVAYDRMPGFFAGMDLYWQPSLSEPWGLAINEAMAAGLPILASDRCGCSDDLIDASNGWLHDPSAQGLEAGLRRAIEDRARWGEMGRASRRRIADWDLDRFADGLLQTVRVALPLADTRYPAGEVVETVQR